MVADFRRFLEILAKILLKIHQHIKVQLNGELFPTQSCSLEQLSHTNFALEKSWSLNIEQFTNLGTTA